MINPLIAALGLDLDLSAEEIADVIWLATQMQQSVPLRTRTDPPADAAPQISTPAREKPFVPPKSRSEQKPQEPQGEIVPQGSRSPTLGRSQELSFQVPDVRSLREPLTLARSLRPLLRRIATGNSTVLNEAATIQRIVEERLWIPVLQPSLEPWLDLALVVDESDSMLIWRRTVTELQRLLENYGVFRTVRVWGLVETADRVQIRPGFGVSARRQRRHSPSELIDPTGRCLVLVVSDCVAPLWQSGRVLPALKAWSQCGAMAIVQMLPEWLWRRTALGLATAVQLRALAPGLPNQQLTVSASESWDEADLETGIKVPVITLEPELFATWTQVVAGRGGVWTPGVVFEPSFAAMEEEDDRPSPDLTAEQRVQRFRLTASPMARRLAGLLAAAPVISLPIVRIVQDRLLNQSRQVHLAEVFLGGLLKPLTAIAPDTNPDRVQYDFFEGVREVLLVSLPLPDSVDVLDAVSKFVASRMGLSLEAFAAVLRNPQQGQAGELAGQMRPFARVTAQVLKRMGGEYAKFAVELERFNWIDTQSENLRAVKSFVLDTPEGSVSLGSPLYIDRPPIETNCNEAILRSGALIRINAPRQMGKSSLMQRILHHANQNGHQTAQLSFQGADAEDLTNLDQFLQWFCAAVTDALGLEDNLEAQWQGTLNSKRKCTNYFQRYLLPEISGSLTLGLDGVDQVFQSIDIATDFFGLLRDWHERGKNDAIWKKLNLVLAHSTECYVPLNINQPPFNVGLPIELPKLNEDQIADLVKRHQLNWSQKDIRRLQNIVDGHPYLLRKALYEIAVGNLTLDRFVEIAATDEGPYFDHLHRHLLNLMNNPELEAAMKAVLASDRPVRVDPTQRFKLSSMGLVDVDSGSVFPLCNLYRDYFREQLGVQPRQPILTILMLNANPKGHPRLRLDEEKRAIQWGLKRSRQRDRFQLESAEVARIKDFRRVMLDRNPQIVHFSGHGDETQGVAFEDELGQVKFVEAKALAKLFALFSDSLQCVILNACYLEEQAEAIAQHIPYVIGMSDAIGDRAAIEFAVGFYDALGVGRDIEFAYKLGCQSIRMAGLPENLIPVLKHRSNLPQIAKIPLFQRPAQEPQNNISSASSSQPSRELSSPLPEPQQKSLTIWDRLRRMISPERSE